MEIDLLMEPARVIREVLLARERSLTIRPGQPDNPGEERHQGARREARVGEDAGVDRGRRRGCRRSAAADRGELDSERYADARTRGRRAARGAVGRVLEQLLTEPSLDGVEGCERLGPIFAEQSGHAGLVPKLMDEVELHAPARRDVRCRWILDQAAGGSR